MAFIFNIAVINEWLTITLLVNIMFGALAAMVSVLVQPSSARL